MIQHPTSSVRWLIGLQLPAATPCAIDRSDSNNVVSDKATKDNATRAHRYVLIRLIDKRLRFVLPNEPTLTHAYAAIGEFMRKGADEFT